MGNIVNYFNLSLVLFVLLAGCNFNQYQRDTADNQYYEQNIHADPSAAYVGEWTAETDIGRRSIKIKEDGNLLVCLSPSSGTTAGKVYIEKGKPALMIGTGAKARVISVDKDFLSIELYGKQEKYYADQIPDACSTAFRNF